MQLSLALLFVDDSQCIILLKESFRKVLVHQLHPNSRNTCRYPAKSCGSKGRYLTSNEGVPNHFELVAGWEIIWRVLLLGCVVSDKNIL